MHKLAKVVAFAVLLSGIGVGIGCRSGGTPPADNTVAATVNGRDIMLKQVEQVISRQLQGRQGQLSSLQLAQARLQAVEGLIQQEVLVQRAEKENLRATEDEVTQFINDRKREGGMTEEEFQKQLQASNQTEEALREEARKLLAIQKLQSKYTSKVIISDREVEDYFLKNRDTFTLNRGVELAAIVVDPQDNGFQDDAKSDAAAKLKIDNIYQQLKTADFAEVARAKSEDPNNVRNGDLGFATEDQLKKTGFPATLIAQFFGPMEVGSYTAPVEFNGRWYIFKLKRKQLTTENRTLESGTVRQEITEALRSQRQELLNAALLEVALREAKIVNNLAETMLNNPDNLGLRPAGATPEPAATQTPAATSAPASPAASSPEASKPTASPQ